VKPLFNNLLPLRQLLLFFLEQGSWSTKTRGPTNFLRSVKNWSSHATISSGQRKSFRGRLQLLLNRQQI